MTQAQTADSDPRKPALFTVAPLAALIAVTALLMGAVTAAQSTGRASTSAANTTLLTDGTTDDTAHTDDWNSTGS
ncbi:hypothetical protein ACWCPF_42075 [Streptomyces sp. NPDC001858]